VDVSLVVFFFFFCGGVCGWGPSFGGSASSLLVVAYGCMLRGEERGKTRETKRGEESSVGEKIESIG
jgi:hypothetical protein